MKRRLASSAVAVSAIAAFFAVAPAQAASPSSPEPAAPIASTGSQDLGSLATALQDRLGDRTAGSYVDNATGKLVVTVTDGSAAQSVRAAGAVPRTVARSGADLRKATETLDRSARIPGTAWGVDPATNQVVVSVDESVQGAKLAKLTAVTSKLGTSVKVQRLKGTLRTLGPVMKDGTAIYTFGGRCSLGFNVLDANGGHEFLTAGHCTHAGMSWYADSSLTSFLGSNNSRSSWVFGAGGDYGLVNYEAEGITALGSIEGSSQRITGVGDPFVGESVKRSGSTTGVHSGKVTALNQTVNYPGVTVQGLVKTNVCAEPGDSGGPFYNGSTGLGLTSGGSGNCSSGGTTFFQSVAPVMEGYALQMWVTR